MQAITARYEERDRMKFRIDLHVHSRNSGDTDADPEESVERAIELGLDGIAFTEHYSFGASEPAELLREKYGRQILILRGVEFSAAEGHCLVFGADTDRLAIKYAPIDDVVRAVSEAGGVVIPSHPYRGGNSLGGLIDGVRGISGVEGYNGANLHAMNVKALEAAARLGLPYTGGSDAHMPREVGSCYTEFDDTVTYDNFIERLRTGRFRGVDRRRISRMMFF
jgi:predicted metal-dependent phosphoesterase TrpH